MKTNNNKNHLYLVMTGKPDAPEPDIITATNRKCLLEQFAGKDPDLTKALLDGDDKIVVEICEPDGTPHKLIVITAIDEQEFAEILERNQHGVVTGQDAVRDVMTQTTGLSAGSN